MSKLIQTVTVAGIEIPVYLADPKIETRLIGCDALYEPAQECIWVSTTCPRGRRKDVVFHELCHAAFAAMGGSADLVRDDANEEAVVLKLTAILRPALLSAGWKEPDFDRAMGGSK